jgi:DNA-binding NarL/FixJ family response regulator
VRVVLADDHPVVRSGLRALLQSLGGYEVVGECSDGEDAVRTVQTLRPDVVVMDVQMPVVDGIEATRRITAATPSTAVLVLTMYHDDDTVFAAMRAGARGYLLKGAAQNEIDRALQAVVAGEVIFGPGLATRVLGFFATPQAQPAASAFPGLTPREHEILDRVAAGQRNVAIARELDLAPKTVSNHLSSIFTKLAVADRAEAIARAREGGLGQGPGP